jgi:hypothetical protein
MENASDNSGYNIHGGFTLHPAQTTRIALRENWRNFLLSFFSNQKMT